MDIKLHIKDGSVFEHLTQEQITEIKENFVACLPDGGRVVIYSETAPLDTCYPWQMVNGCCYPIGKVKHFREGAWV